jgi:hypothetical protein
MDAAVEAIAIAHKISRFHARLARVMPPFNLIVKFPLIDCPAKSKPGAD